MNRNNRREKNDLFVNDFETLQLSIGMAERTTGLENSKPMMSGQFCFHSFQNGLSMHSVNAVERQNTDSSIELPPGLSFNYIFSGVVHFDFAQHGYTLQPTGDKVSCSAIINSSQEVMKRRMRKGEHVKKLNIFVERGWLEARCKTRKDRHQIDSLFARKCVLSWIPSAGVYSKALELSRLSNANTLAKAIHAEQLTMQVLATSLEELIKRMTTEDYRKGIQSVNHTDSLKSSVNEYLSNCSTVSNVAHALNMSERSLQRKFKEQYGECISSYIKQRKMEKAKVALLIQHKSIGEAAYIAGYKHPSSFISAFKKQMGTTPSKFVRSNR